MLPLGSHLGVMFAAFLASPVCPIDPLPPGAVQRLGSPRFRHGTEIVNSALSPDGKLLATAGTRTVIVWDVATGKRLHTFPSSGGPTILAFSPTGKRLAVSWANQYRVWDTIAGRLEWTTHNSGASDHLCRFGTTDDVIHYGVIVVPNNNLPLAHKIETRRIPGGELIAARDRKTSWNVIAGGFVLQHDDEKGLATVFDWVTGREVNFTSKRLSDWDRFAASPDLRRVARITSAGRVEVLPTQAGKVVSFPLPESLRGKTPGPSSTDYWAGSVSFSDDGKEVCLFQRSVQHTYGFAPSAERLVLRWDAESGKELPGLEGHTSGVADVHYPSDGKTIITSGRDGTIRRWDRATGRAIEPIPESGGHPAFSADSSTFAFAGEREVQIYNTRIGVDRKVTSLLDSPIALALSPDGSIAATRSLEGVIHLLDTRTGKTSRVLSPAPPRHLIAPGWLRFSPDGSTLAASSRWETILWDLNTVRSVRREGDGHATFIGKGREVVACVRGRAFEVRESFTSTPRRELPVLSSNPHYPGAWSVDVFAVPPDGRWGAVGDDGGGLLVQDLITGKLVHQLPVFPMCPVGISQSPSRPPALAFSADGKFLAVGTTTNAVEVWEIASGSRLIHFDGHDTAVRVVQFAPDGRTLWSAGNDVLAYRWDVLPRSRRPLGWDEVWTR